MAVPARAFQPDDPDMATLALQGIPAGIMVLDGSGRVRFASPRMLEILGGEVESLGDDADDTGESPEFPRKEAFALLRKACESGTAMSRLLTLDRVSSRYFQVSAGPIPGEGTEKLTAVLILELTGVVSQGDIAKEFVRQVRHDLRGPLTSMRGAVDLLLTGRLGPLEEKQKRILALVEKATHQMTAIVSGRPDVAGGDRGERAGGGEG
jgi:nitrogen-specific signal transduction histidine kinase